MFRFCELLPRKYAALNRDRKKEIDVRAMDHLIRYGWPEMFVSLKMRRKEPVRSARWCIRAQDLPPQVLREATSAAASSEVEWQIGQHLDDFVRNQERNTLR